ncbi:MAG: hypothetical protein Kow00124_20640 [Anaerolineae bacterium]
MPYVLAAADPDCADWISRLRADLALSGVEVRAASTMFEVGSIEWRYSLEADIEGAVCFIFFASLKRGNDSNLACAADLANPYRPPFIPVLACEDHYVGALRCILGLLPGIRKSKHASIRYVPRALWRGVMGAAAAALILLLLVALAGGVLAGVFGQTAREALGTALLDVTDYPLPGVARYVRGRVLFEDDFESGAIEGWEVDEGWEVVQDPETGSLVLQGTGRYWARALAGSPSWRNYAFDARARVVEYSSPPFGTGFGMLLYEDARGDCDTAFYLWRPSIDYAILARADDGPADGCGQFVELDLVPFTLPVGDWLTVRVDVFGSTIHCYVNDDLIASAVVPDYLYGGRIGFQVPPGSVVWFDDVRVTSLNVVR